MFIYRIFIVIIVIIPVAQLLVQLCTIHISFVLKTKQQLYKEGFCWF